MFYVLKEDKPSIDNQEFENTKLIYVDKELVIGDSAVKLYKVDKTRTERLDLFGGDE